MNDRRSNRVKSMKSVSRVNRHLSFLIDTTTVSTEFCQEYVCACSQSAQKYLDVALYSSGNEINVKQAYVIGIRWIRSLSLSVLRLTCNFPIGKWCECTHTGPQ